MKNSIVISIVIILIMAFVFLGFYIARSSEKPDTEHNSKLVIVDDYGRNIAITNNPERIISISPSTTEILFKVGVGDKIVGVDEYSNYPEEANNIETIGSYLLPNLEKIISLDPDLLFVSDITSSDVIATIEDKDLTVIVLAPQTINEIINDIRLVGEIFNKIDEANNIADELKERINSIITITSDRSLIRPNVYIEYFPYWTYGPGSFGNDLIIMAGGKNIAATTTAAYAQITNEFLLVTNPEIILLTVGPMASTTAEELTNRTGWDSTDAIKNGNIYTIDEDIISRPGPRIIDALEQLAEIFHPKLFSFS